MGVNFLENNYIRWLHLSDFHVGRDSYGQIKLFEQIINHIDIRINNGKIPDFIFITGDIAHNGQQNEYDLFMSEFINPLKSLFDNNGIPFRLYVVPGNHDYDRNIGDGSSLHVY